VNGSAVPNPAQYWQLHAPELEGDLWVAIWDYDTGVVTKAGGTVTLTFRHDLPAGTYDGFDTYPPGFSLYDFTCTAKVLGSRDSSGKWAVEPTNWREPGRGPRSIGGVTEALRVERGGPNGAIARVTLSRPERRNAFDASVIAELRATFAQLE